MRILLLTAGSRGDVEPFLALAHRAQAAGHDVRLAVTREFLAQVHAAGIDAAALDGDYAELVRRQGVSPWAAMRGYRSTVRPMLASILRSAVDAAVEFRPDVLVYHPKVLSAPVAAAHLGVPHVLVEIVPVVTPTREFPAAGVTTAHLGALNPLTYRAAAAASLMFAGVLRDLRAKHRVPARGPLPPPAQTLVPVSPTLLARPQDWPGTTTLTGPWHSSAAVPPLAQTDPELDAFLAGGGVVYAGFGSMAAGDPHERGRAVLDAVRAAGHRALIATGWGGLQVAPGRHGVDVLVRSGVPHDRTLSRCVAAIHHAGAGTAHAAVRAGAVSIPVPFLADQPFWAALLDRRGLGSSPVPARRLDARRLTRALTTLPDSAGVTEAARAMATEDGCGTALDLIVGAQPLGRT